MTYRTPVARVTMLDDAALARHWAPTMRALCNTLTERKPQ